MKATFVGQNDGQNAVPNEGYLPQGCLWKSWRVFNADNLDWDWILDIEIRELHGDYRCRIQTDYPEMDLMVVVKGESAAEALYKAFTKIGIQFDTSFTQDEAGCSTTSIGEAAINAINHEMGTHNPFVSIVENF